MSSIWRWECTRRLRADDLLTKILGGGSQIIAAEFWETPAAPPAGRIATNIGARMIAVGIL